MITLVRWWVTLLGGALAGAGVVLHGQVELAHYSREQVQDTFFLWRGLGQVTFIFQGDHTKLALWLNEIPDDVLVESNRAAWTLVVVGAVLVLMPAFIRKRKKPRKR